MRLQNFCGPLLQNRFHFLAELVGECAVDEPMIEGKRKMCLGTNGNSVAFDNGRNFLHRADPRIATCGWLMTGVAKILPKLPKLVIENVPPCTSSGFNWRERARVAKSTMERCRPATFFSSALRITGTMRPPSSATAMPILMSDSRRCFYHQSKR